MGILLYAGAWFLFAVTHSLLARVSIQQKIENYLGCLYRLVYNLLALFSIGIVLLCGRTWLVDSRYHFFENTLVSIFCFAVQLIGFAVLIIAFARYDIGRFVGITQLVTREKVSSVSNDTFAKKRPESVYASSSVHRCFFGALGWCGLFVGNLDGNFWHLLFSNWLII